MNNRFVERPFREGLVTGKLEVTSSLFLVVGLHPVMRDQAVDPVEAISIEGLVPLSSTAMQDGSFRSDQRVIGGLLGERVLETVDRLRPARFLAKKIQAQEMMNRLADGRGPEARHRLDALQTKGPPQNGR